MEILEQLKSSNEVNLREVLQNYKAHRFELPPEAFFKDINRDLYWFPVELTPWAYLPSYAALSENVKRRYNQLYALGTNEVFAVFETEFINTILLKQLKEIKNASELSRSLQDFCDEETKHAEMFHRLNAAACPEYYGKEKYFFSQSADKVGMFILGLVKRYPSIFGVWVWIALFFEERSLAYGRHYLSPKNAGLSEHFRVIHKLHMIEEVHHVRLDEVFVDYFYRPLSTWKRRIAATMLKRIVQSYITPRRLSRVLAKVLADEFPHEKEVIYRCLSELPQLRHNQTFLHNSLGPKATERTRRQMSLFAEFKDILGLLP